MTENKFPNLPNIPGVDRNKLVELREAAVAELNTPPRIAIIGSTGAGKSSTLNAMFNAGFGIDHVRACTQQAEELHIDISAMDGANGSIILYDMPGLSLRW